jgi:tRNA pseudouridine55 synthase
VNTRTKPSQAHGLLILNKPSGPTSTHCLEKIKRKLGQKKIGHAGTLDPLAQGILLVLLGQATKIASYLTQGRKRYQGLLRLGMETDTYDVLGKVVAIRDAAHVSSAQVEEAFAEWLKLKEQDVPPYSAAKHKGRPLYALSRAGREVPKKRKPIDIYQTEVMRIDLPLVRFRVECSAGTYIRSLVHSLGIRLQCGAVLEELIRESSHPFTLAQAHDLESVLEEPETFAERVISLPAALPHLPRFLLSEDLARKVRQGVRLPRELPGQGPTPEQAGSRALFLDTWRQPLALVELQEVDGRLKWTVLRGLFSNLAQDPDQVRAPSIS